MRALRITGLVIFLLSSIAFVGFKQYKAYNKDNVGPEINYPSDSISVSVDASEQDLSQEVTAFDKVEGDVTASIIIEKISKFTSPGKRTITYAAFDSSNNIAKRERELVYTDYISPRYSLSQPLIFNVQDVDILKNMTVSDCIDGDLTNNIKYDEQDYTFGNFEGIYDIKLQVTNSAGDTAYLPVEVEFRYPSYEKSEFIPKILLKEYLVYCKIGETFDAWSYLDKVLVGHEEHTVQSGLTNGGRMMSNSNILLDSNVDMRQAGVYQVKYSMTTDDGYTGITKLIVVVEE